MDNRRILNEKPNIQRNVGGYLCDLGEGKYFITNPSKHKLDKN